MSEELVRALLETAAAETDGDGFSLPSEGRSLNLHFAHDGVSLVIGRVVAVRLAPPFIVARSAQGEETVAALADLYAGSIEGKKGPGRKAGFV